MVSTDLEHRDQSPEVAWIGADVEPDTRARRKDELENFPACDWLPRLRRGGYRTHRKQTQVLFGGRWLFGLRLRENRRLCLATKAIEPIAQGVNANAPLPREFWL
jgi:hypothetical protein